MTLIAIDSKIRHKRSTVDGVVPEIGPSSDHTDGTWLSHHIYSGELFLNIPNKRMWIGVNEEVVEVPFSLDGSTEASRLKADLNSLEWGIHRSLTPPTLPAVDAVIEGEGITVTPCLIDLTMSSDDNLFMNYPGKVFLERYKPMRRRGRVTPPDTLYVYNKVAAKFTREFLGELAPNIYNRVNLFDRALLQTIDIKPQTYFRHFENDEIRAIGVPADYGSFYTAKQIFRFCYEVTIDERTIKKYSPSFQILVSSKADTTSSFFYGVGSAYGQMRH